MSIAAGIENLFMARLLAASPQEALQAAMDKHKKKVIDINQKEQLEKGEDAEGRTLGTYKNYKIKAKDLNRPGFKGAKAGQQYRDFKHKKNKGKPGYDRADLKLSGETYKSFDLKATEEESQITFDDQHDLREKYGPDITGIQKKNLPKVAAIVKPELERQFRKQIMRRK